MSKTPSAASLARDDHRSRPLRIASFLSDTLPDLSRHRAPNPRGSLVDGRIQILPYRFDGHDVAPTNVGDNAASLVDSAASRVGALQAHRDFQYAAAEVSKHAILDSTYWQMASVRLNPSALVSSIISSSFVLTLVLLTILAMHFG